MNLLALLQQYLPKILALLQGQVINEMQKPEPSSPVKVTLTPSQPTQNALSQSEIDWTNPKCQITPHFTVSDACMLHSWNRLATEADGLTPQMKDLLITLCKKMEEIRSFLGCSMNVHCMFRSQQYNKEVVKAIPNDVHAQGLAIDFDCNPSMTIDQLHAKLEPVLEQYGLRMERNTPTWCHVDLHPVVNARYFNA